MPPHRIIVIGTSGSGKTTLARALAKKLEIPHIELDSLYWEPNWVEPPVEKFKTKVEQAIAVPTWVLDGNYGKVRDAIWKKGTTIIWLDYSFRRIFSQSLKRTFLRWIKNEKLWQGNQESLRRTLFSKESILWWVVKTYSRRKKEYAELLKHPDYRHLKVHHLKSPQDTKKLLNRFYR